MAYIGNRSRIAMTDSYSKAQSDSRALELNGYTVVGEYASGIVITRYDEVIRSGNEFWRVSGSTELPYTTTGAGLPEGGAFVTVGNAALRNDLAAGIANVFSSTGTQTVAEALDSRNNDTTFRKSIAYELPLLFPDYEAARGAVGSPSFIYPQGFDYDDEGRVFIYYSGGTSGVVAYYGSNKNYLGWFIVALGGESIIVKEGRLFKKTSPENLASFSISPMPETGATLASPTTHISGNVGNKFTYANGVWVIEQQRTVVGTTSSNRTKWDFYNDEYEKTGELFVDKSIVGWVTPSNSDLYPYVPKTQGVALYDGDIVFGNGGSYIPASQPYHRVADFGVAAVSPDGSLKQYGLLHADKLIPRLLDGGYNVDRTESEGLAISPEGHLHHLFVGLRPGSAGADQAGIIIFREFDPAGEDYSDIRSEFNPVSLRDMSGGIFPRGKDGACYNPITGEQITGLEQLLRFMREVGMPETWFYTTAVDLAPELSLDLSSLVVIRNANNRTFFIEVSRGNDVLPFRNYSVTLDDSGAGLLIDERMIVVSEKVVSGDLIKESTRFYDGTQIETIRNMRVRRSGTASLSGVSGDRDYINQFSSEPTVQLTLVSPYAYNETQYSSAVIADGVTRPFHRSDFPGTIIAQVQVNRPSSSQSWSEGDELKVNVTAKGRWYEPPASS